MKTILVLTDFSKKSQHAAEYALCLAKKAKANILLLNLFSVAEEKAHSQQFVYALEELFSIEDEKNRQLKQLSNVLRERLKNSTSEFKPSIEYRCKCADQGSFGKNVAEFLSRKPVWLIVMGAKADDSLCNFIFGTKAFSTISNVNCPVLFVCAQTPVKDIRRVALISDSNIDQSEAQMYLNDLAPAGDVEALSAEQPEPVYEYQEMNETAVVTDGGSALHEMATMPGNDSYEFEPSPVVNPPRKLDLMVIRHQKENVFQRIFHSPTTKLLVDNGMVPLMVFPGGN